MASGGGGSQVSTQGVPEEFMPHLEKGLGVATARLSNLFDETGQLKEGALENVVAGFSPEQLEGQESQTGLARQALSGTGIYDTEAQTKRLMQNALGQQTAGGLGALGSSRMDRAQQAALADLGMDFVTQKQAIAEGGAQSLQDVGATKQTLKQAMLDAPKSELAAHSQYISGNVPKETKTTGRGK